MTAIRTAAATILRAIGLPITAAYIDSGGGGGPRERA